MHTKYLLIICLLLLACTKTKRLTHTHLDSDENNLWLLVKKEQEKLDKSGLIYKNKELDSLLTSTVNRLLKTTKYSPRYTFEIRVINNPFLNAFAFPNGKMYIHTGLLAEFENESQLATVLAHELIHPLERHTIREKRGTENTNGLLSVLSVGSYIITGGSFMSSFVNIMGSIAGNLSVAGHSRSLEDDADNLGFDMLVKAKYDPRESAKVFKKMLRDLQENKIDEPFFFGSHPSLESRIENFAKRLNNVKDLPQADTTDLRKRPYFKELLVKNATTNLEISRFPAAERSINKLIDLDTLDSHSYVMKARLYKTKKDSTSLQAQSFYKKALEVNSADEHALFELAILYVNEGENEKAEALFSRYKKSCDSCKKETYVDYYLKKMNDEKDKK